MNVLTRSFLSARAASRLAWSLAGLSAVLLLMAILFSAGREPVYDNLLWGSLAATSATVGALVAARHPRNPIGWLVLCGAGVHGGLMEMLVGWGQLSADEGLPAGGGRSGLPPGPGPSTSQRG